MNRIIMITIIILKICFILSFYYLLKKNNIKKEQEFIISCLLNFILGLFTMDSWLNYLDIFYYNYNYVFIVYFGILNLIKYLKTDLKVRILKYLLYLFYLFIIVIILEILILKNIFNKNIFIYYCNFLITIIVYILFILISLYNIYIIKNLINFVVIMNQNNDIINTIKLKESLKEVYINIIIVSTMYFYQIIVMKKIKNKYKINVIWNFLIKNIIYIYYFTKIILNLKKKEKDNKLNISEIFNNDRTNYLYDKNDIFDSNTSNNFETNK